MNPALENLLWLTGPGLALAVLVLLTRRARGLRGRGRATATRFISLLLLAYFLFTSGLGIFWVARQELPVFDLHYLFGYITAALVLVHVAAHWRGVAALFKIKGSAGAQEVVAPRLLPLVVLALVGAAGYGLGWRAGSERVRVSLERPAASAKSPRVSARGAGETNRVLVKDQTGKMKAMAMYYHDSTRHTRRNIYSGAKLDLSRRPETFKAYPDAPVVKLPDLSPSAVAKPTGQAVEARRQAPRNFTGAAITLSQLATVLRLTNGVTRTVRQPGGDLLLRAAPSAGALYPTETYVVASRVEGLPPGIYHYGVKSSELRRIEAGETFAASLAALSARSSLVKSAPATLLFSAVFVRSAWKYRARSWRYCLLDAGHLAVQAALAAAAQGLASHPVGAFDDRKVNMLLGLDEQDEGALMLLPLGHPEQAPAPRPEDHLRAAPRELSLEDAPELVALAHGMTGLAMSREPASRQPELEPAVPRPGALIPLPGEKPPGDPLGDTVLRRRSIRRFADRALTRAELGSMIHHVFGESGTPPLPDPSPRTGRRVGLTLVVQGVQDLAPGVYAYHPGQHAVSLIKRGPEGLRRATQAAALHQDVVGRAGVLFVFTVDAQRLAIPDGDRGYRHALLEAGMLGGQVYLQATALGLGCTGIGAFFDDEVAALVGADSSNNPVVYLLAVGPAPR